jgi:outer membrane receptor protein involved in Fe transport
MFEQVRGLIPAGGRLPRKEKSMQHTLLRQSIRQALEAGTETYRIPLRALPVAAFAAFGLAAVPALAQDDASSQQLETITVTGSNIRRVDIETSNPVITIDRAEIEKSGKLTVGDLLQQLPTIAGAANNPNVNNSGGTGGSFISLRGLGTNRTLILVDGKRVLNGDVNSIPSAAIERIEVLTSGASAVYGSDAIAGVVNFILRKDYQGAELTTSYGVSDRDDGARQGFSVTFGQTSERGSLLGGIDYNKSDMILAGHREFSRDQLTIDPDTGEVFAGGSPTGPGGKYFMPIFADCASGAGTFDGTSPANGAIPAGYRCYLEADENGTNDEYNFAPLNLISTPQERTSLFLNGNYKLSDTVEAYMTAFHNKTSAAAQLAELPFSLNERSGLTWTADNPYNPFGVDIGVGAPNGEFFAVRLKALGPRVTRNTVVTDQGRFGLKGSLFDSAWQWDVWGNYGRSDFLAESRNFLNAAGAGVALSGDCIPYVEGEPLTTATCLNIADQNDPITAQLFKQFYSLNTDARVLQIERQAGFDINGTAMELPAGALGIAAGANYRKIDVRQTADTVTLTDPLTGGCPAGSQTLCTNPFSGGYNVKEAYIEAFVPILKDLPFVHSLNLTLGDRYSKYDTFGSTNNWKAAIEYRPIEDLLLRGTVTTVFRAPNNGELFTPLTGSADNYIPPAATGWNSSGGDQIDVFYTGAAVGGFPIKPETGKSFDFGVVYDPQWLEGLSVSADLWRIYLNDIIIRPTGQTVVDFCFADANSPYCDMINFSAGVIQDISGLTIQNFGRLDTKGIDLAVSYRLPETAFGNFRVGLNASYLTEYNNSVPGAPTSHVAGTYQSQYGNFPRWRALGTANWQMGDFSANWTQRYQGRINLRDGLDLPIGAVVYHNLSFGYNIDPINTRLDIGVDNVGDKQPPLFYQATTNANIDINTYDPIGRFYWGRVTVKF